MKFLNRDLHNQLKLPTHTLSSYTSLSPKLLKLRFHTGVLPSSNYPFLAEFEVVESRGLPAFCSLNEVSTSQCLAHAEVQGVHVMMSSMKDYKEDLLSGLSKRMWLLKEEVCPFRPWEVYSLLNPSSLKLPEFGHFILDPVRWSDVYSCHFHLNHLQSNGRIRWLNDWGAQLKWPALFYWAVRSCPVCSPNTSSSAAARSINVK